MSEVKKMPLKLILADSLKYMASNVVNMTVFSIVHILFLIIGFKFLDGWHNVLFLPWIVFYYFYWYFFFRFYFNRKPYLFTLKLARTLIPSTKILAITFIILTVLLALPLLPPFLDIGSEWTNNYVLYLKLYMEDTRAIDTVTIGIIVLVSPFIFYRPIMAWIASVLGRSSLMSSAYAKTRGNYWKMVLLGGIFNISLAFLEYSGEFLGVGNWLFLIAGTPLIVYLNVILAKMYEYFFLEVE
jgi:hypothetical protein